MGSRDPKPVPVVSVATPPRWRVSWHPKALEERDALGSPQERLAINLAVEKLRVDGPALAFPHQSAVRGRDGSGLRELRPRRERGKRALKGAKRRLNDLERKRKKSL